MKQITLNQNLDILTLLGFFKYLVEVGNVKFVLDRFQLITSRVQKASKGNVEFSQLIILLLNKIPVFEERINLKTVYYDFEDNEWILDTSDDLGNYLIHNNIQQFLKNTDLIGLLKAYEDVIRLDVINDVKMPRYKLEVSKLFNLLKAPLIIYNFSSKVSFGKKIHKSIDYILKNDPHLIVYYVKKLKHFAISFDVISNPLLINYLGKSYFDFASLALVKLDLFDKIKFLYSSINEDQFEYEKSQNKAQDDFSNIAYNWAFEYFPEDDY